MLWKWSILLKAYAIIAQATNLHVHGSTSTWMRSGLNEFTSPTNLHASWSDKRSAFLLQMCFQIGCTTSTLAPTRSRRTDRAVSSSYVLMIFPTHPSTSHEPYMDIMRIYFSYMWWVYMWRTLEGPLWLRHAHACSYAYAARRSNREFEWALVSCQALVQGTQNFLQVQFPQNDNVRPKRWNFKSIASVSLNLRESCGCLFLFQCYNVSC